MERINVPLEQAEVTALVKLSRDEKRHPREQAALLIRDGLQRAGLLPIDAPATTAQPVTAQEARHGND